MQPMQCSLYQQRHILKRAKMKVRPNHRHRYAPEAFTIPTYAVMFYKYLCSSSNPITATHQKAECVNNKLLVCPTKDKDQLIVVIPTVVYGGRNGKANATVFRWTASMIQLSFHALSICPPGQYTRLLAQTPP